MRRRSRQPLLILALLLVAVAFFTAPKVYQSLKKSIAAKHARHSEAFTSPGQLGTALEKLQAANKLDPDNLEISRKLAEILNKENPEEALEKYKEIVGNPQSSAEDKMALAQTALDAGDIPTAEFHLQQIDPLQLPSDPLAYYLLKAKVYETRGKIDQAIRQVRIILVEEETKYHQAARFLFIRLAVRSKNPILMKEAKDLLGFMAQKPGEEGLEAIRFYFGLHGFSPKEAHAIFVAAFNHPLATTRDKLDAATLYQRAVPGNTSEIIEALKAQFDLTGENPEELYDFCYWLAGIHQWEAIAESLSKEVALASSKLFALRLDALNNLGHWSHIVEETEQTAAPIPSHFRLAFRARALGKLDDEDGVFRQLDLILKAVRDDRDALIETCEYLEKTNEPKALLYLVNKAVENIPALEAYACSKRIRHGLASASLDDLCNWYGTLYSKSTNLSDLRARKTYFDLLADNNLGEAILNAKSLYATDPQSLEHRIIMALAHYKSGEVKLAQDTLDNTPGSIWRNATVGWKMLYAHILRKTGFTSQAEAFLQSVPTAKLSRAERQGFENL